MLILASAARASPYFWPWIFSTASFMRLPVAGSTTEPRLPFSSLGWPSFAGSCLGCSWACDARTTSANAAAKRMALTRMRFSSGQLEGELDLHATALDGHPFLDLRIVFPARHGVDRRFVEDPLGLSLHHLGVLDRPRGGDRELHDDPALDSATLGARRVVRIDAHQRHLFGIRAPDVEADASAHTDFGIDGGRGDQIGGDGLRAGAADRCLRDLRHDRRCLW